MGVVHAKLIVSGAVQKAGYRDVVGEAAFNFKLKGYVKNQKNGTVEIVCEGEKSAIEKFAQKINFQKYPIIVDNVKVEFSKATGKFKSFDIEREKDVTAATFERMDVTARYMREMNDNLGNKMDGLGNNLGNKIDSLGSNLGKDIRGIGDKVDNMADRMDANFEQMEKRYHVIHDEVKATNENLTKMVDKFSMLVDNFTKMVRASPAQQDKKQ